jgi:hypothetical protein
LVLFAASSRHQQREREREEGGPVNLPNQKNLVRPHSSHPVILLRYRTPARRKRDPGRDHQHEAHSMDRCMALLSCLTVVEQKAYSRLRRLQWLGRAVHVVFSLSLFVLAIVSPLIISGNGSFQEVGGTCLAMANQLVDENPDYATVKGTTTVEDKAHWQVFPAHIFNVIATGVSLVHYLLWFFFSPHAHAIFEKGPDRKRKRGGGEGGGGRGYGSVICLAIPQSCLPFLSPPSFLSSRSTLSPGRVVI